MKYRRLIAALLLPPTLFLVTGCTSNRAVPTADLKPPGTRYYKDGEEVRGVITESGDEVQFDEPVRPVADTLYASVEGQPYNIALLDADQVIVKRTDAGETIGLTIGVLVGIAAALGAAALIALASMDGIFTGY